MQVAMNEKRQIGAPPKKKTYFQFFFSSNRAENWWTYVKIYSTPIRSCPFFDLGAPKVWKSQINNVYNSKNNGTIWKV